MAKRVLKLKIKDITWTVHLMGKSSYIKAAKCHDVLDSRAFTAFDPNVVYFSKEHFTLPIIVHELTHVYFHSCLVGNTSIFMNKNNIEEVAATIFEYHLEEFRDNAHLIYKHFTGSL